MLLLEKLHWLKNLRKKANRFSYTLLLQRKLKQLEKPQKNSKKFSIYYKLNRYLMALFTKSIQKESNEKDGIRICIMRRIKPEFEFDIWIPSLSPSTELLKDYHDKKIDWETFEKKFTKENLNKKNKYLTIISDLVRKYDITLLCWEETPEMCHRRLVAEYIKNLHPEIILKHS